MFFIVKYSMVAVAFYLIMSGLISVDFSGESFGLSEKRALEVSKILYVIIMIVVFVAAL